MEFRTTSRKASATACLMSVEGEVDVYTSPQVKQELVALAESGVTHVILNLSQVEYLDSTGLGVLISGLKRLRENGGNLALVGPGMRILRIFEITGLDRIFDIYPTEQDALTKEGVTL